MPYYTGDVIGYRGDYYRGDYYRGDPGLFSFLGKALGGIAKLGTSIVRSGLGLQGPPQLPQGFGYPPRDIGMRLFGPGGLQIGAFNPVNGGGIPQGLPAPGVIGAIGAACPRGFRLNKSTYIRRGGGTAHLPPGLVIKGTTCVRARRMNVGNAHALRRSLRRVTGFAKLTKRAKRAISRAASAVGIHRGGKKQSRAPQVRIVKAA